MKNKILPLSLVTLVIFLGAFLISATITFPESFLNDPDNEGEADKSYMSTYLTKLRVNQQTLVVDQADVLNAQIQAGENASDGTMEDFNWKFLGPDNVGGFTKALLFDNRDELGKTIIAGALTGGLYKSVNTGLTWTKINGIESNLNITGIAQTADGTIYAGTGGYFIGSGIYMSPDGENFSLLSATAPSANEAFAFTNDIAVNQDNGAIYVATELGVWYSSDNGTTWAITEVGDTASLIGVSSDIDVGSNGITAASVDGLCYISESGNPNQFVLHSNDTFNLPYEDADFLELAIAPSNPDILYATVLHESGDDIELTNIYRSDDKGVHWRVIAPGGSSLNMFFTDDHNVLTVFPENPDKILVGGADMWEGTKIDETGFFQWTHKSLGFIPPQFFPSYVHTFHNSYTFRPGVNNEVFVGSNGGISKGTITSQYYEFVELNKTYTTSNAVRVGISGYPKVVLGGFDQNGVQIIDGHGNPAQAANGNQIWFLGPPWGGNGGEVFISVIDPLVAIFSLESTEDGDGRFVRDEELGVNPSASFLSNAINFPDNYLAPTLFWENINNENSRDTLHIDINTTIPAGTDLWIYSPNRAYPFAYTTEIAYYEGDIMHVWDPVSTKLFIGTEEALWMTTEILNFSVEPEWFMISNDDAGLEGTVSAMAMSEDANFVFVGTEEGHVYRIANIALAYNYDRADVRSPYCIISTAEIPLIDPVTQEQNTQIITSLAVDQADANNVVVTLGNYGNEHYIYKTTDALSAEPVFSSVQGNLPLMPIYSSIIEMNNSNMCIIGTEMGIYETQDLNTSSPTWNTSFGITGQVPVYDLKQQTYAQEELNIWFWDGVDSTLANYPGTKNYGNIYAATYGRGLFFSNKYQKPVGIITQDMPEQLSSINIYPNPASTTTTIEYTLNRDGDILFTVFDINGKAVVNEKLSEDQGTHQYKLDCSSLPHGMYVVSINTGKSVQTGKFIITH
ncbi:MAG: T9SS type A sorting domain-containing protein [Bacteroidota bacterium]